MCAYWYQRAWRNYKGSKKIQERTSEDDLEISQRIDTFLREQVKPSACGFVASRLLRKPAKNQYEASGDVEDIGKKCDDW